MDDMKQLLHTHERSFAGCIVTLVHTDTGETRVEHAAGYSTQTGSARFGTKVTRSLSMWESLARLVRAVDEWEGNWKVRTISTPQTIYADLKGRQDGHDGARPAPPEAVMLTQIGRIDMWEGHHADPKKARARAERRARADAA